MVRSHVNLGVLRHVHVTADRGLLRPPKQEEMGTHPSEFCTIPSLSQAVEHCSERNLLKVHVSTKHKLIADRQKLKCILTFK